MRTDVPLVPRKTLAARMILELPPWFVWIALWLVGAILLALPVRLVMYAITPTPAASAESRSAEDALIPFAYSAFCLRYPGECVQREGSAKWQLLSETQRMRELERISARINASIVSERNTGVRGRSVAHRAATRRLQRLRCHQATTLAK